MGLSSSQARLLNLTSRMHQIEYKAAKLQNEKLQMANASRQAYLEYQEATEKTKIQIKSLLTNASATYVDINSYDDMLNAGFAFVVHGVPASENEQVQNTDPAGTYRDDYVYVEADTDQGIEAGFYLKGEGDEADTTTTPIGYSVWSAKPAVRPVGQTYVADATGQSTEIRDIVCTSIDELQNALTAKYKSSLGGESVKIPGNPAEFRAALSNIMILGDVTICQKIVENGVTKGWPDPANEQLDFSRYESSVATNTSFQEVEDTTGLRKAEAKYEADMRRIDMKDRKFDYDLQALDAERNAIKQEMETLKTVAKDNVERTFKLFS